MKIDKSVRIGVLTSLIASIIFLYFLQPIFDFLGRLFLRIVSYLFANYIDRLYAETATGSIDYSFLAFVLLFFLFFFLFFFVFPQIKGKVIILQKKSLPDENKQTLLDKPAIKTQPSKYKILLDYITYAILSVIVGLIILFILVGGYIRLKTIATFNQQISIIAPYIKENEKLKLISEYASIQSKKDYDILTDKITKIARDNNINLPPNKLYPF